VHKDKTMESLGERERWLLELTRTELAKEAQFETGKPRFRHAGLWYHFDWRETEKSGDIFYRQDQELAARLIQGALTRTLQTAAIQFEYGTYGQVVSVLKPFLGSEGWLELSKLNVQSLDVEEFLIFAARSDDGRELDEEACRKLMALPAKPLEVAAGEPPALDEIRKAGVDGQVKKVEERNGKLFDEEVFKLDRWSDDVKLGLEREIKELDRQIREARRMTTQVESLKEKLEAQKTLKALEGERNRKRRELFQSQDQIDAQRDGLIQKIEGQLQQKLSVQPIFRIRWSLR
jgi:adenine-specific DNA-methyltransferase